MGVQLPVDRMLKSATKVYAFKTAYLACIVVMSSNDEALKDVGRTAAADGTKDGVARIGGVCEGVDMMLSPATSAAP